MQNHAGAESEPPHKILKLQTTRPKSLDLEEFHPYIAKNKTREDETSSHEAVMSQLSADSELSVLISLMSSRLPESQINLETDMNHRDAIHFGAETKSSAAQAIISQPIGSSAGGVSKMAPPKRYYRTFWRSMAGKALERAGSAVGSAEPLSHPLFGH